MYKAKSLSPMIPSYDIPRTASFFTSLLNFEVVRDEETYVILHKDHLTLHILRAGAEIGEMEFYLEVDDVNYVWNSIQDHLDGIRHKAPFDREYGMREIHVVIPETKTLLFIGQPIA